MTEIKEGDKAHAQWGGGNVGGKVVEKKENGPLEIESKGKKVSKTGEPGNAAFHLKRSGNDVVKKESELTKDADGSKSSEEKGSKDKAAAEEEKKGDKKESKAEHKGSNDAKKDDKKDGKDEKKDEKKSSGENGDTSTKHEKDAKSGDKRKATAEKKDDSAEPKKSQKTEAKSKSATKEVPPTTRQTRSSSQQKK